MLLNLICDTIKPMKANDLLTASGNPATKSFENIVTKLQQYLSPKVVVRTETFHLNKQSWEARETITQNIAVLKTLSECLKCKADLNNAMHDRLASTFQSEANQKKLLMKVDLTAELAVFIKTAAKGSLELNADAKATKEVVKLFLKYRVKNVCKEEKKLSGWESPV